MYRKLIKNIIFPLSDKLMGLSINKNLKKNRSTQWYTSEELSTMQQEKLFAILSHCNDHIPYVSNTSVLNVFSIKLR